MELALKTAPFPSSADLFYLLFGPLLAAGLLQLTPPPRDRSEGSRLALDVAITVSAIGLYFWRFLLAPPLSWGLDSWMTGVTLAYPLLDLLLLSLLLLIVMHERRDEPPRPKWVLLGLGITAQVGADLLYNAATAADTYWTRITPGTRWTAYGR